MRRWTQPDSTSKGTCRGQVWDMSREREPAVQLRKQIQRQGQLAPVADLCVRCAQTLGCPEVLNKRKLRERRCGLHLRFLCCLLWILRFVPRGRARISFRVFRLFRGYVSSAVARPAVAADPERLGRRFCDGMSTSPNNGAARAEPPFALGTCALEFWILHESGVGGL